MKRSRQIVTVFLSVAMCVLPTAAAEIESLDWLAGCWRSEEDGRTSEECWTPSSGGMLLGVHRDVGPRGAAFEFLRIAAEGETVSYFASPSGRAPTAFRLVESGERRVVFENPDHDFPQRLIYWLEGKNRLRARAESFTGGEKRGIDFAWDRVKSGWKR
jgi:hypothetical protein